MSKPYSIRDSLHRDSALSIVLEKQGIDYFLSVIPVRPSTPTIVNIPLNDGNWTAIATSLTDVLEWRISERSGADFYFAFDGAPANYATAFGWVSGQSSISAIYAKRTGTTALNIELIYWKI